MGLEYCSDGISMIDPDLPISQSFTLRDLCLTNHELTNPNYPNQSSQEYKNLKWLATTLEELAARFGRFTLLSGFRSYELQQILNPTIAAAGKRGFHEAGMAVDIYPEECSVEEFFCRIITSDMKEKLGEIAIKPSQNSLHLSLPTERTRGVAMEMDENDVYHRLTAEQCQEYIDKTLGTGATLYGGMSQAPSDAPTEEMSSIGSSEEIEKPSKLPLIIGLGALLVAGLAYLGLKARKK